MSKATITKRLQQHFGEDPSRFAVVQENLPLYERPNLHLALSDLLEANSNSEAELVGVIGFDYDASLSKLSHKASAREFYEGPVEYTDVPVASGRSQACIKQGLYLFKEDGHPLALLVLERERYSATIGVEVMGAERPQAEAFLRKLISSTRLGKAYRGQVLSVFLDCYRNISVGFHSLPKIQRSDIILPEVVLRRIERHTIDFNRHVDRLQKAGRHLKRGILLHGLPGTGKTLSAMYMAAQMPERTVLLATALGMGGIETICTLARILQPSTVVLEDVDLIGTRREHQAVDANAILFELLNQMDGLAEDTDILFILTTNRPDILEPALASRPGRIDQAIEIPLPDEECRHRLFDLYGKGLRIEISNRDQFIEQTAGVSAAFVKELLRKAAVFAAIESDHEEIVVKDQHLEEALTELLVAGGELTKSLLGAKPSMRTGCDEQQC